jgi:hypothetical protein
MMPVDESHHHASEIGWKVLEKLELPIRADTISMVSLWLRVKLSPLILHEEILARAIKSMLDAAARIMKPAETAGEFELHIIIFTPADYSPEGQNWGFFLIEKNEDASKDNPFPVRIIELYMYLDE